MRTRNERAAGRRVAAKLAAIKRAAGDEAEDVIDDVSDALDVEKDDVVEVVVDDPDGLVAELEVAGETELAGEVQEISLKVRQDYDDGDDGDDDVDVDVDDGPREARRRTARMAARRRMASRRRLASDGSWDPSDFTVRRIDGGYVCSSDDGYATVSIFQRNGKWAWINHFDDDSFQDERAFGFNSAQSAADSCFDEVYECDAPRISDARESARRRAPRRRSAGAGRRSKWAWSQNEFEPTDFGFELSDVVSATASSACGMGRNRKRSQAPRKNAAGSRQTLASMLRKAYSWDLLEDFAEAMGVEGDPDGKAQNTLDALANGQENVQDYVAFLREDGDEFKSKVADELLSEFGKADLAPEPGEQQAEPTIDVDDVKPTVDTGDDEGSMPYGVDDPVEARRAAARKAAMRAAKARRSAKPSAPKGGVRVSRRSAVAGVAGQKPQEDNTTVDKSAFLFV